MSELLTRDTPAVLAMEPAERLAYFLEREAQSPVFVPNRVFRGPVRDIPAAAEPALDYETAVERARDMARLALGIVDNGGDQTPEFYIGEGSIVHELAKLMVRGEYEAPDFPVFVDEPAGMMLKSA